MKFGITKTSDYLGSESPCENAKYIGTNDWNEKEWEIEFESLEQLIEFVSGLKNKKIVLSTNNSRQHIEIYDTWRE